MQHAIVSMFLSCDEAITCWFIINELLLLIFLGIDILRVKNAINQLRRYENESKHTRITESGKGALFVNRFAVDLKHLLNKQLIYDWS